jgi:predicted nucleic acid-binding protein
MIKLDDALSGVTKLGLDTSPFIYFIERNPAYVNLMREIFTRIDNGSIEGYSSTITLTEVLIHPKRIGDAALEANYRNLLLNGRNFTILSIDPIIADLAADLRSRYNIRTPDALQIAAALSVRCEAFLSNDFDLRRVTELRVLTLSELEL